MSDRHYSMDAHCLDLDLLRCFLAVAETGGFTAAAKRLHLSQSAVSLKIQRLESLLDHSIFTRSSRSLALTSHGEIVLGYARRLLALGTEMMQAVSRSALEGALRLGVAQQFGDDFLPALLARFKRANPAIRLSAEVGMTGDLLQALEKHQLDLVLGAAGHKPSAAAKMPAFYEDPLLVREKLVWTQSANSRLELAKDPIPLVAFSGGCGFRKAAIEALDRAVRAWQIVYSSGSASSVRAAVRADLGISVFNASSLGTGLRAAPASAGLPRLPDLGFSIYRSSSANADLASLLSRFIEEALVQSPRKGSSRKLPHARKQTARAR